MRLTPFEHYMFTDDNDTHPMTCGIRFFMSGPLQKNFFAAALTQEAAGHPLFKATTNGKVWVVDEAAAGCVVEFLDLPVEGKNSVSVGNPTVSIESIDDFFAGVHDQQIPRTPIVLKKGERAHLRIAVLSRGESHHLVEIRFHHATCDGIAIFNFYERALLRYRDLCAGVGQSVSQLTSPLQLRDEHPLSGFQPALARIFRVMKFFARVPFALRSPGIDTLNRFGCVPLQSAVRQISDPELVTLMKLNAKAMQSSLNDWMLAAFFEVLMNRASKICRIFMPIRVAVATSLRRPDQAGLSACNVVSMVFLDRSLAVGRLKLIQSIQREMDRVKRWRLGSAMVEVFRKTMSVPGLSYALLWTQRRSATAVLTNLGIPFRDSVLNGADGKIIAGGLRLENLETWPPVRRGTALAVSVNTYGGVFSVTGRFDPGVLSTGDTEQILREFMQRVRGL